MAAWRVAPILLFLVSGLATAGAVAQEPPSGTASHSDPKSDVAIEIAGQAESPPVPDSPVSTQADLTDISVTDADEERLVLRLRTQAGFQRIYSGGPVVGPTGATHVIRWSVPGAGGTPVPAVVQVDTTNLRTQNASEVHQDILVREVRLCFPQPGQPDCSFSGYGLERHIDQGTLVISVPKSWLTLGGAPTIFGRTPPATLPLRLVPGDLLSDIYVRTLQRPPFYLGGMAGDGARLVDRAPNTGSLSLPLVFGSPAPDLRMSIAQRAVPLGEESQVPVLVQNFAQHKRIVNFTASVVWASSEAEWKTSITPSVTLGAGKSTNVTLRVRAPPASEAYATATVKVRATILTEPGTVAVNQLPLLAAEPLDRDHSKYHIHGVNFEWVPNVPALEWSVAWMNRREVDRAAEEPFAMGGRGFNGNQLTFTSTVTAPPEPNPAALRPGEPIKANLEFDFTIPATAHVTVVVQHAGILVGQASKAVNVQAGRNKVELDVMPLSNVKRFDPSNGTFRAEIRIGFGGQDAFIYSVAILGPGTPKLVPRASYLVLPLEREFPAVAPVARRISLAPAEELESFVNPGRTQVFEFDLRNEEPRALVLAVEALNVTEGWDVQVKPSGRIRLASGEGLHLGVLATAPMDAKEGDVLKFRAVARDVENDTLVAGHWIRLITTRGVDIENETFEVDQDDARKLDRADGSSSALPLLVVVAAIGFAVLRRRRT